MFWQLTGQAEAPTTRWESRSQTALHRRPNPPRRLDALKRGTWGLLVSPRIDKRQLTSRTMVHINMPASEKVYISSAVVMQTTVDAAVGV